MARENRIRGAAAALSLALVATASASNQRPDVRRDLGGVRFQRLSAGGFTRVAPLDAGSLRALKDGGGGAPAIAAPRSAQSVYLVYNLEFDRPESCAAFNVESVKVFNRFDRFADLFIPYQDGLQVARAQAALRAAPGLVRAEGSGLIYPPAPPRPAATRSRAPAEPETIVRGGVDGATGKGTIIAVVDSGVDFRHPDFISTGPDGKPVSRLLYLWDTTGTEFAEGKAGGAPPLSYPDGAPLGTLYTREHLTAELRAARPTLAPMDMNGHGTACAGIAAGSGAAAKGNYTGAAPGADLIMVKIAGPDGVNTQNSYLLNYICGWVDRLAGPRPAVISCSFGGHHGGHDGNLVEERQLNARFAAGVKGRALCIAAGNEGTQRLHAELVVAGEKDPARLSWRSETGGRLSLYFSTERPEEVRFAAAPGTDLKPPITDVNPLSRQVCLQFNVPPGQGGLLLTSSAAQPARCDAYLQDGQFDEAVASFGKMVCTPGLTYNALTVGSYDWNDTLDHQGRVVRLVPDKKPLVLGALSGYSNPGPSRNLESTVKPDVVAPGQFFIAPVARDQAGGVINGGPLLDTTGHYRLFNGTSAATPYTAGIVALMFERRPALTVGELKDLMRRHASSDRFTGKTPNAQWGFGKLDFKAARALVGGLR